MDNSMAGVPIKKIQVSQNGHFLVKEDGKPFFWLGDTAFELFHRGTLEEADFYFENRRKRGFNLVYAVILAQLDGLNTPNAYGHIPLQELNPEKPNELYFEDIARFIKLAASKRIYIGLLPTWGDKVTPEWEPGPAIFNLSNALSYGAYIGTKFRKFNNLVWILGGDRRADKFEDLWRQMAVGITQGLGYKPIMTYHPTGKTGSSMWFHNAEWLDINMWQSGHYASDLPNWEMITNDYSKKPIKPVLDGESNYEDHPIDPYTREWEPRFGRFNDYDVRKQAYRSVFAGACGYTYGHHSVWQMYTPGRAPKVSPVYYWQEALFRPGAAQLIHLRNLVLSRPYLIRTPDQSLLISNAGEGAYHTQAALAMDGSYAFIYIPKADQNVEVDLRKLDGKLRAWWYDPREGNSWQLADYNNQGSGIFRTPLGGPDWVLVLDVINKRYAKPGAISN